MVFQVMVNILECLCIKCCKCRDHMVWVGGLEEGSGGLEGHAYFVSRQNIRSRMSENETF